MISTDNEINDASEVSLDEKKFATRFKVNRVEFAEDVENRPLSPSSGTGSNDFSQTYDSPQHTVLSIGSNDSYTNSKTNDTHFKTFGKYTHEALPHVDHYRNLLSATAALRSRPTLEELHEEKDDENLIKHKDILLSEEEKRDAELAGVSSSQKVVTAVKFGWIKGVLVRCLLNIWGVMLFLRLSWVVGQAGTGLSTLVVLLSGVVTVITSLSMAAICTNGQVKGGGAYYMISRSLGPEFGGAIGLIFSVANAVAVAMYVVGFSETVRDLLVAHDALMVDEVNDIRIVGIITITFLFAIAIIGMEWEARAQLFLLLILIVALINFVIGTFIPPSEEKYVKGFTGYHTEVFEDNFFPDFRGEGFFSVFSIFFPAATGILAGANISGDLKDAQYAIPRGTMIAIVISSAVYILVAWILGSCIARETTGYVVSSVISTATNTTTSSFVTGLMNSTMQQTLTTPSIQYTYSVLKNCSIAVDGECKYGLLHDFQVMEMVSGFGPLITAGIFSATLSSALASLVSAPKVFQAVCKDRIFPGIHVFAKGYGADDNPKRAYVLAYVIGIAFICIGDLNAIAPIISNFFLMSYTLINYSCFDASLARSPGWRPAFKYYSMWLSLLGALLCLAVMFVINWWTALITFAVVATLFVYVHYRKPDVNWGSSSQAHVYRNALQTTLKLLNIEDHIKNFRPQVLVLTGNPNSRPALVDFVSILTRKISLMVCGNIIIGSQSKNLNTLRSSNDVSNWLHQRKIKAFYSSTTATSFRIGVQNLLQISGIGKLKPNILIMGFKSDWKVADPFDVSDYFNVIHDAFDLDYGVGILRIKEGFYCENPNEEICNIENDTESIDDDTIFDEAPPTPTMERKDISDENLTPADSVADVVNAQTNRINHGLLKSVNRYRPDRKQKKGTIDVWWLFDDGGLTLLLPYLLTTKSQWSKTHLRVFIGGTKRGEIAKEQRQLATMLTKFRIDAKAMHVVSDIGKIPKEESKKEFDNLMEGWLLDEDEESKEKYPWKVTQDEITLLKDKTNRHIRLKELLLKHSSEASLIIVTLPMPRKGTCSPGLYMAWVDYITRDMPPILLLRGNQKNVLTFYS